MQRIQQGTRLGQILAWCESQNAGDLHIQADRPYTIRVDGRLKRLDPNEFPPMTQEEIYAALTENLTADAVDAVRRRREHDLSFYHGANRYRANFSKQKGTQSLSFRFVPQSTKTLSDLRLPESLFEKVNEILVVLDQQNDTALLHSRIRRLQPLQKLPPFNCRAKPVGPEHKIDGISPELGCRNNQAFPE